MNKEHWKKILSFKVLGAILIFGSWVTQNYFFNAHDATVKKIEFYNIKRDYSLDMANSWWMAFVEIKNLPDVSNKDKVLTATNFITTLSKAVKNDLSSLPESVELRTLNSQHKLELEKVNNNVMDYFDPSQLLKLKDANGQINITEEKLKKLLVIKERKDISQLADALEKYLNWTKKAGDKIVEELDNNHTKTIEKAETSNKVFLLLYIAGAIVGGIGFLFDKSKVNTDNNEQ